MSPEWHSRLFGTLCPGPVETIWRLRVQEVARASAKRSLTTGAARMVTPTMLAPIKSADLNFTQIRENTSTDIGIRRPRLPEVKRCVR